MPKIKVIFDRERCIGAAACAAVCPRYWKMNEDSKADLIGADLNPETNKYVLEKDVTDEELKCLQDSPSACPVQVIEIL